MNEPFERKINKQPDSFPHNIHDPIKLPTNNKTLSAHLSKSYQTETLK